MLNIWERALIFNHPETRKQYLWLLSSDRLKYWTLLSKITYSSTLLPRYHRPFLTGFKLTIKSHKLASQKHDMVCSSCAVLSGLGELSIFWLVFFGKRHSCSNDINLIHSSFVRRASDNCKNVLLRRLLASL